MSKDLDIETKTRVTGQAVFVWAALFAVAVLLSQLTKQAAWVEGSKSFAAQPRFWPAVALITMFTGLAFHAWRMRRRRPNRLDWAEARRWAEPLEYVIWFMVYVFTVPIIGFLPMSIAFACGLVWRLGYRSRAHLLTALIFAIVTVMIFKGFLGVRIPGAALYEYFPDQIRSFALQYL